MRVTIRMFARLREIAGRAEWTAEAADDSTVRDVWRTAAATHPDLAAFDGSVSCAVNAEFASMTARVADGDEVAFLPPVSGGTASNF